MFPPSDKHDRLSQYLCNLLVLRGAGGRLARVDSQQIFFGLCWLRPCGRDTVAYIHDTSAPSEEVVVDGGGGGGLSPLGLHHPVTRCLNSRDLPTIFSPARVSEGGGTYML